MSFQAYLDNIKAKTGKSADDFKKLAEKKGLLKPGTKAGEIVVWLKKDFELGHGHAMAIYAVLKSYSAPVPAKDLVMAKHFNGSKASWKAVFDGLLARVQKFGNDIRLEPTNSYISILRENRKFAIVQVRTGQMYIGIKWKNAPAVKRLEPAGTWNAMVTHRVCITEGKQVDKDLITWLKCAYDTLGLK